MEKYLPSYKELKLVKDCNQNIDAGYLGGYIKSSNKFLHGDPATWFPELWKWVYDKLKVCSVLDVGCGEGHSTASFKNLGEEAYVGNFLKIFSYSKEYI